jgi:hypothetical protein
MSESAQSLTKDSSVLNPRTDRHRNVGLKRRVTGLWRRFPLPQAKICHFIHCGGTCEMVYTGALALRCGLWFRERGRPRPQTDRQGHSKSARTRNVNFGDKQVSQEFRRVGGTRQLRHSTFRIVHECCHPRISSYICGPRGLGVRIYMVLYSVFMHWCMRDTSTSLSLVCT